jgi:hypothetical protein
LNKLIEKINSLPELPVEDFEEAGKLGYSDKVPVVTIRPHKFSRPEKPSSSGAILNEKKSSYEIRKYYAQVTYPLVVCQPPPDEQFDTASLFEEEDGDVVDLPKSKIRTVLKKERFYKLTKLNGKELPIPFWCYVHYGPWLAQVTETESCISGIPNSWDMFVYGIPEVNLSWYGHWEDIPPYPLLNVIMGDLVLFYHTFDCCSGFSYCLSTQSCKPLGMCSDNPVPT